MTRGATPDSITIVVADPADAAHRRCVVSASADTAITDATYLPPGMDETAATGWLADPTRRALMVVLDGTPVGAVSYTALGDRTELSSCEGNEGPVLEVECWLLPHAQNRHVMRTAMLASEGFLTTPVTLFGVIWEHNLPSRRMCAATGYREVDRVWWGDSVTGGWCTRVVKHLH